MNQLKTPSFLDKKIYLISEQIPIVRTGLKPLQSLLYGYLVR